MSLVLDYHPQSELDDKDFFGRHAANDDDDGILRYYPYGGSLKPWSKQYRFGDMEQPNPTPAANEHRGRTVRRDAAYDSISILNKSSRVVEKLEDLPPKADVVAQPEEVAKMLSTEIEARSLPTTPADALPATTADVMPTSSSGVHTQWSLTRSPTHVEVPSTHVMSLLDPCSETIRVAGEELSLPGSDARRARDIGPYA